MNPKQERLFERIRAEIDRYPFGSPPISVLARELVIPPKAVENIVELARRESRLVVIEDLIYITPSRLERLRDELREEHADQWFSIGDVKERYQVSRKYADKVLGVMAASEMLEQNGLRFRVR